MSKKICHSIVVPSFTRGFMDRIRDRCRELEPEAWAEIDELPYITERGVFDPKNTYAKYIDNSGAKKQRGRPK
jgi:hypothetical protein